MIQCVNEKYPYFQIHETGPLEIGNGLLILSKYPILTNYTKFVKYTHLSGSDAFSQKGALGTIILVPNYGYIRVITTHNQADIKHWDDRLKNLETSYNLILDFQNKDSKNPEQVTPALYIGDINLGLSENYDKEYVVFTSLFGKNTFLDSFGESPLFLEPTVDPTCNNMAVKFDGKSFTPERDDYIMMTKDHFQSIDYGVIKNWMCLNEGSCCSDHFPVFAKLKFFKQDWVPTED